MKFIPFRLIFFLSSLILLSSCLGTNTPTAVSNNASFVSLTYVTKNKITTTSATVFTLVDKTIVNVDSLPFKTSIDSVSPTFNFATSAKTVLYFKKGYKNDSILANGNDTIDFRQLLRVRNYATDGKAYEDYDVVVNVHQVDPELYQWFKVSENLSASNITNQKAVILNDKLFFYSTDGANAYLYTSTNGYTWNQATVIGLPVNTPLNDMIQFNGKLYLTQDGANIYSSADGLNWTNNAVTNYTFKSLLYVLNGQLWAVVQSTDGSYHFAITNNGNFSNADMTTGTIPDNFPVKDFASVTYNSPTGKPKVLVSGGYSATDNINPLKNRWSTEDGSTWVDFSRENNTLDTLAVGASIISYDSKLFVIGKSTVKGTSFYKVSVDEGLSWQNTDTSRNKLPKIYEPRSYQSVVVFKPLELKGVQPVSMKEQILESNRIFIIGGINGSTVYSDIWTSKLNRKNFLRQ